MATIADALRAEADELEKAAQSLLLSDSSISHARVKLASVLGATSLDEAKNRISDIITELPTESEEKRLVSIIVGLVTARINNSLAMVVETGQELPWVQRMDEQRRKQMDFNRQLNQLVARGDWDGFNQLTERYYQSLAGGDQSESRDQPASGSEGEAEH